MKSAFFKDFGIPDGDCEIDVQLDNVGIPRLYFRSVGHAPVGLDLTGASQLRNMLAEAGNDTDAQEIERHIQEALRLERTTVPIPSQPVAGTAPQEVKTIVESRSGGIPLEGTGGLIAQANVPLGAAPLEIGKSTRISFRDNLERAESLARAASATIKRAIEQIKSKQLNEPEWQDEIDFLEFLSSTLDQIDAAIGDARRAATSEDREQKLVQAETLATSLANACRNFAERNYDRVVDYAGYSAFAILGTLFFTELFPMSVEDALAAQLVLLGLSGSTKK
jgi:hypothetical protein